MKNAIPSSNSLRERLLAHQQVQGAFLFLASPDVDEIMALAGFGALIVDREHAASDLSGALAEFRAIRAVSDVPVLVRVGDGAPAVIKPLLDAGFDGIVAADIRSVQQARQIVEAAHYPPIGRRGAQFTVSRAADYGHQRDTYVEKARRETLLVAMIESREGVEAIAEIAGIDGIDMLFIGPLDLTSGYGRYGDLGTAELKDAIALAEKRIMASGCLLGGAAILPEDMPAMFERGYALVTAASDTGLLVQASKAAVRP